LRATIFIIVSLAFILFDCNYKWAAFLAVRSTINLVISPLQLVADLPTSLVISTSDKLSLRYKLIQENEKLKAEQLLLIVKSQKLAFLERENQELRTLLDLSKKVKDKHVAAEILAVSAHDFNQHIIIDRGKSSDIYIGQPLIDAYGVMGQVIEVNALTSRAMLITDAKSAIPVIDIRNGMRTIAIGVNDPNILELAHVPDTADVKEGDVLVTSGIGVNLPSGYAVGVVGKIEHIIGERFAKVVVIPYARVNSSRSVLLLWPEKSREEMGSAVDNKKEQKNNNQRSVKSKQNKNKKRPRVVKPASANNQTATEGT
jgi:rod shape-determining protein MreC